MKLNGKRALVTGGANGIGAAIARRLAQDGCAVAIADLHLPPAEALAQDITAQGGHAVAVQGDVSKAASVATMVEETLRALGGLDILVNNAGIIHPQDKGLEDSSEEAWDITLSVNLKSIFLVSQKALPALEAGGGGAIVNIASIVGLVGSSPSQMAYTASKGGVIALTREMGVALARRGVRVNAVAPGLTATAMGQKLLADDEAWHLRRLHIPMGRMGVPEEIAALVAFLASDDASYMTAQVLAVDGGMVGAYLSPPD